MKKLLSILVSTGLILISQPVSAHNGVEHKVPIRGQFCPKAASGHKHGALKCTVDGARTRWK